MHNRQQRDAPKSACRTARGLVNTAWRHQYFLAFVWPLVFVQVHVRAGACPYRSVQEQHDPEPSLEALFSFVHLDPRTRRAAQVVQLQPSSPQDVAVFTERQRVADARKAARQQQQLQAPVRRCRGRLEGAGADQQAGRIGLHGPAACWLVDLHVAVSPLFGGYSTPDRPGASKRTTLTPALAKALHARLARCSLLQE